MRIGRLLAGIGLCPIPALLCAQPIDTVLLEEQSFTHLPFLYSVYSSLIDRTDDHYLYTAGLEYGFCTFDISDPTAPDQILCLYPPVFNGLKPTNLFQENDLLFISLGGFHGTTQRAGLAIYNVNDPENAVMLDQWDSSAFNTGSAIVRVQDGYAYLGAMESGVVVLDVSEPDDISFVSAFQPDTVWPGIVSYPPNARGMALKGDTLFLAYDAGGIRAIDVSDKSAPFEIGHYVNPQQPANTADAYNNLRLVGDLCYVASDFCGFEVVDISDPANMQQIAWVNPWDCNGLSWFGSDGHTNELITAMHDSLLFISGGDSEVLIYDITAPASPQLVGGIIQPNDSAVVWGLDVKDSLVVLNYINNSAVIFPPQPYYANDGGYQMLTWRTDPSMSIHCCAARADRPSVSPNPTNGPVRIRRIEAGPGELTVLDPMGRVRMKQRVHAQEVPLDLSPLGRGCYMVTVDGMRRSWVVLQ